MSVNVQCPHCQARYRAPDKLVGRRVRCPKCQQTVSVTAAAPLSQSAAAPAAEDSEAVPAQTTITAAAVHGHGQDDDDEDHVSFVKDSERAEGDMDMTPMVDVTFLLLIFFMVTAAFSLQKSLQIPTPTETQDPSTKAQPTDVEQDPDYVIVHVDAFNTYRVVTVEWEKEAPSEQEMYIQLREARQGDARGNVPTRLLVKANGDALHEKVVAALDAGSEVGMEEIQLQKVEEDEF
jgi:biopolymer transport protein ExbD